MQSPSPWSIKGIPPEAREIAKAAAAKEGITLGEWFKRRILEEFEEKQKGAAKTTATTQKPSKPKQIVGGRRIAQWTRKTARWQTRWAAS
jgi:hypothetical protein